MGFRTKSGVLVLAVFIFGIIPQVYAQEFNKGELLRFAEQKTAEWEKTHPKTDSLRLRKGKFILGISRLGNPDLRTLLPVMYQQSNLNAAEAVSNQKIWMGGIAGLSLSGCGQVVGYWDEDTPLLTHQEFSERVTFDDVETGTNNDHATKMAGTILATGKDAAAKGMAFAAAMKSYNWNNDAAEMALAASESLSISAHPYINTAGWVYDFLDDTTWVWYSLAEYDSTSAYQFGYYDEQAKDWDHIAYNAPDYLMVKAAGNQRGVGPGNQPVEHWEIEVVDDSLVYSLNSNERPLNGGDLGFKSVNSASLSKNVLVVGAVKSTSGDYTDLLSIESLNGSGFGPTDDGRIKPDLVAPGDGLYTSDSASNASYGTSSGTSAAASVVAGSAALIAEHYQNLFSGVLSSAGMKALLSHTADDIGNTGPDFKFGWGMLNTERAARFLTGFKAKSALVTFLDTVLADNQTLSFEYENQSNSPLKITIAWTDPAGVVPDSANDPNPILVNDLDLEVMDEASGIFVPWKLQLENPGFEAGTGNNSVDNIEQVWIESPANSTYEIEISHKGSLQSGSQRVTILISPEEPEILRTTVADGNWNEVSVWKDAEIPTENFNRIQISHEITLTENQQFYSLDFEGENGQLNLNGNEVTLTQNYYHLGNASGFSGDSNSSLTIAGWGNFSDSLKFAEGGRILKNMIIDTANPDTIHLASRVEIIGKLSALNGVINSGNGNLVLVADASNTANFTKTQGEVLGEITYKRTYYPGSGWRLLSVPFNDVSFSSLNEKFHTQGGEWASYQVSEPNSNLWFFDAENQSYTGFSGEDSAFTPGTGFLMYMYENFLDDSPSLPASWEISGSEAEQLTVPLHRGASDTVSYNLVGNPFAATLDWHQLVADNDSILKSYAIWNPALMDSGGTSGFQYYNEEDRIGAAGKYIAPMQGFFVQSNGGEPEINFTQNQKTEDANPEIIGKRRKTVASFWIQFHLLDEVGNLLDGEIYLVINSGASKGKDNSDVTRISSLNGENTTLSFLSENGTKLAFEGQPLVNEIAEFEMLADIDKGGSYKIQWPEWINFPEEWKVTLRDKLTGDIVNMKSNSEHFFEHQQKKKIEEGLGKIVSANDQESRFIISVSTEVYQDEKELPKWYSLQQNYPNPFNPSTAISFDLPESHEVKLNVFDLLGRKVAQLVNETKEAGKHTVYFDASNLSSGVYIYRIEAGAFIQNQKMMLIK
ncbi:MAG: S8 family serine peptidase [Balneolaceae bacterium]